MVSVVRKRGTDEYSVALVVRIDDVNSPTFAIDLNDFKETHVVRLNYLGQVGSDEEIPVAGADIPGTVQAEDVEGDAARIGESPVGLSRDAPARHPAGGAESAFEPTISAMDAAALRIAVKCFNASGAGVHDFINSQ